MQEASRAGPAPAVSIVPTNARAARPQHQRVLEDIATGEPLPEILARVVRLVESEAPGLMASVLVVEGDRLRHGAAPSLPDAYNRAIDGIPIRDGVGSCGTAAATRRTVVVEDVRAHPYWTEFRQLADEHGLRACWSTPIFGREGECVGTFALYHREARAPTVHEERLVAEATHLAGIAIQHDRFVRAEAKRTAEATQAAQLRSFFKNAPFPISVVLGPDLVIDFVNPAYERLVSKRDIVGKRVRDAFPELESQGLLALLMRIYETGEPFEDPELRVVFDRTGSGVLEAGFFNVRIEPLRDDHGGVRGLVSVAFEVTAQVRSRGEIDALRGELGQREKMSALGQLVSGVAHEIRTPLTYLTTNLNLIQMRLERLAPRLPREDADASLMLTDQYLPSAIEAADRINHLVEDLRAFTHLKSGSRERGSVTQVVAQAIELFRATHRGRVTVQHEASGDVEIDMDKVQVQQVILNLLQNALEAVPRDHTIRVSTQADAQSVRIAVADKGGGIPAEAQPRIFDPFFTTREGGTGLGLSIVKRIVDDHRGTISFTTGGEGTTFIVVLPSGPQRAPA